MRSFAGARPVAGGVEFRVWAPRCESVAVKIVAGPGTPATIPMRHDGEYFTAIAPNAAAGTEYLFILDGERERPDPRSRRQPHGVHGPSVVVDPKAFAWNDSSWHGVLLENCIFYELHTGTFSARGTFAGVIDRLAYLKDLGVTVVELMPVASFPGKRNWGYDGVHLFAPQESYGGPDGLRALVDAAHAAGLGVALDVVYNHLGPEGNYLREFGPYFTDRYKTPWGEAVNYDGPDSAEVRAWIVANAVHWIEEYHVDALRLDAVHAIFDSSARHIIAEIAEAVHASGSRLGRPAHVIAECALNDARVVLPAPAGGCGLDAQWNDDFHHAVRTALTGDRRGYLAPFGRMEHVRQSIVSGYVRPGEDLRTHKPLPPGAANSDSLPGERLVAFIQNHDQVANASAGKRLPTVAGTAGARTAAALLLTAPSLPLLFMGEEYGETRPFLFFVDFPDPGLSRAVREGRAREMTGLGVQTFDEAMRDDPTDPRTFERSCLAWGLAESDRACMLRLYRDLLALRKNTPALAAPRKDLTRVQFDDARRTLAFTREAPGEPAALVAANLGAVENHVPLPAGDHTWRRVLFTEDKAYGGSAAPPPERLAPGEPLVLAPRSTALYLADVCSPFTDRSGTTT